MDELEQSWPDEDRRDGALERLLIRTAAPGPDPGRLDLLSLQAMAAGLTEAEAAAALGWNRQTTHDRLKRCRLLLGAKTTTQAVAVAFRRGLIT